MPHGTWRRVAHRTNEPRTGTRRSSQLYWHPTFTGSGPLANVCLQPRTSWSGILCIKSWFCVGCHRKMHCGLTPCGCWTRWSPISRREAMPNRCWGWWCWAHCIWSWHGGSFPRARCLACLCISRYTRSFTRCRSWYCWMLGTVTILLRWSCLRSCGRISKLGYAFFSRVMVIKTSKHHRRPPPVVC